MHVCLTSMYGSRVLLATLQLFFWFASLVDRKSDHNDKSKGKGKSEHLYSALHGIQTTLKHSGMDHTAFNLQRTPCQPLPRKRSPDGASTKCGG